MPDVLPAWFPHARYDRDRTGGAGLVSEFGFNPPTPRLITFRLVTAGSTRANLASPALRGPAIIKDLTLYNTADGSAVTASVFSLLLATSAAVDGNSLAFGVVPPGVVIFDQIYTASDGFARPLTPGFTSVGVGTLMYPLIKINRIVTDDRFFVNFTIIAHTGAFGRNGMLRVYENVDPGLMGALLD